LKDSINAVSLGSLFLANLDWTMKSRWDFAN